MEILKTKPEEESALVPMNQADFEAQASRLREVCNDLSSMLIHKKRVVESVRNKEAERDVYVERIADKKINKKVPVYYVIDFKSNEKRRFAEYQGKEFLIETLPVTQTDRQLRLDYEKTEEAEK